MRAALVVGALVLAGVAAAAGAPPGERPIVVRGCEGLYYERDGRPDLIVVSDLPLAHSAYTAMHQMTQAIKLTLKDRGFRAGRFTVGYVVCDDSGPAGSWSAKRCAANARASALVPNVVAMIGTLESGCALVELPLLATKKIILVSPLNTDVALTRPRRGPVVRLSAPDDAQAAAAAVFLRQGGAQTVAALSDGTPRGNAYRAAFQRAARRTGLELVKEGADAVYVGGVLSGDSGGILRLARTHAPAGRIVLAAGFGPAAQLASVAGAPADGVYLAVSGLPVERLPPAGRRFADHFESALHTQPHAYAIYAAQAARILLDAIAGGNGTRPAVAHAALRTRFSNGLVGALSFDAAGDPRSAPVTIFRLQDGGSEVVRIVDSGVR